MSKKIKKSLGEMLLDNGIITKEQWTQVQESARTGKPIREALKDLGLVSEDALANVIAEQLDIPRIDLSTHIIDPKIIELVPEDLARKHKLIPVLKIGSSLTCAMADVFDILGLDELMLRTGLTIEQAISTEEEINKALDEHYSVKGSLDDVIKSLDEQKLGVKDENNVELNRLKGITEEPPVIKLVNMMVLQAVREGASDIHIEPEEEKLSIRFRIDGILYEQNAPSKSFQSAIISRIKILADLDISERRKPQDGRFQIKIGNEKIDIRVSSVPTIYGENVVLRLLNVNSVILGLESIGFDQDTLENYENLLKQSHGIILVTGPTGSGKTTSIYASLNTLNSPDKNIVTIEDPVEYRLAGTRQMQVNPDVDLTFANGLRSLLRQDPDIIMVGEIRDLETAEIAIQASLTGHLVLATLHTNDAPGAITRLIDMGIEPFLISSSLIGVLAQRLVRLVCKECESKGCNKCFQTGYKGRTGIYELMLVDGQVRRLTAERSSTEEIRKAALAGGMKTLREHGNEKVKSGKTTQEEVLRVTQDESL